MKWACTPSLKASFFNWVLAGCAAVVTGGCHPTPKPAPPPLVPSAAMAAQVDHFAGTPLSGPTETKAVPVQPKTALAVEITLIAVERIPPGIIDGLGPHAQLIVATRGAVPVRSTGRLARTAGFATGPAAEKFQAAVSSGKCGRTTVWPALLGALAPGVTLRLEATDSSELRSSGGGADHRRIWIELHRAPAATTAPVTAPADGAIDMAVMLEDYVAGDSSGGSDTAEDTAAPSISRAPVLQQETVLLDPQSVKAPVVAVTLPFHFRDGTNESVAAIIRIRKGMAADARHVLTCATAAEDVEAHALALSRASTQPAASPDAATILDTLSVIRQPSRRRSGMVYLAGWSGARICEDVALSADDAALARLAHEVEVAMGSAPPPKSAVAWRMDRLAMDLLFKLQADSKLPPELAAVLVDRAGEAGRHPSTLEEVLRDLGGAEELEQRLLAANRLYLEDSSPSCRARAFEWLSSRRQAPPGYDPLGTAKERRANLEKAAANRASTPQHGPP